MAKKKEVELVKEDDTTAIDTLKAGSKSVDDPKSITNFGRLAQMIGAFAAMRDETSKTQWYDEMIARAKELGHGVGVDDESAHNRDTVKTGGNNVSKAANPAMFTNPGAIDPRGTDHPGGLAAGIRPNPEPFSNPGALHSVVGQGDLTGHVREEMKKEVEELLSGQELTEEFKEKVSTLFEAAVSARLGLEIVRIEEENEKRLEEQMTALIEATRVGVEAFCEYVAEEWMKDNEVAITSSLRLEIAEEFISGLKELFESSFIDVPEEKFDVVDALAKKVDELEVRLSEAIEENASLRESVGLTKKTEVVEKISEGLTIADQEKFRKLAEDIDDEGDLEIFRGKLETIKEHYFSKEVKTNIAEELATTDNQLVENENVKVTTPEMKMWVNALERTRRNRLV